MNRTYFLFFFLFSASMLCLRAQQPGIILGSDTTFRVITTAVPFLLISPDARAAALGDAGAALSPDINSAFWNPAKVVFMDNHSYGAGFSWTPWLGKIVNDMWIAYLPGFYKISREQAVAGSLKYFDLGDISFRGPNNEPQGDFNPRELAFDITYSRMLTTSFSIGLTGRYIYSNLTGSMQSGTVDARPINSVAVDLGMYYTKELQSAQNSSIALSAAITNIGPKVSYTDNANRNFIPTNLRLGAAYTRDADPFNSFTFLLDLNKLMVPTVNRNQSVLSGMFGSFTDAPDGFTEEIKEFIVNTGVEYWYNKIFAARIGYFLEAKEKGKRKYMTLGLGFRNQKNFGIDVAYLVPTNSRENPLAETLRFSLLFQVKKAVEESVTD